MVLVELCVVMGANRITHPSGGSSNPTGLRKSFLAAVGGGRSHCTAVESVLVFRCEIRPLPYMVPRTFIIYFLFFSNA